MQNPEQPDQLDLATTENDMLLEGKEMPVSENDDHMVHIAVHQEALGQGADEIVGSHISKHQIMMNSGVSANIGGNTPLAGNMAAPQPVTNAMQPVEANVPIPPGTPPGQMLPQQNIPMAMAGAEAAAAGNLAVS